MIQTTTVFNSRQVALLDVSIGLHGALLAAGLLTAAVVAVAIAVSKVGRR